MFTYVYLGTNDLERGHSIVRRNISPVRLAAMRSKRPGLGSYGCRLYR
jgi:hypothetical protein